MTLPPSIRETLENLEKNYVSGHLVASASEVLELIRPSIVGGSTVASGNSLTLRQAAIFDYLASDEHEARFINQFEPGPPFDENRIVAVIIDQDLGL